MMHLYDAAEGILDRCCFAGISSFHAYATGYETHWSIPKASLNSTVVANYQGVEAPYWGGYNEFTGFFNNNSHLITTTLRSCYCLVRTPPNRDDINCFFSGNSCTGPCPVDFSSDLSGCIISKFNFANNSDSNGYFWLFYANIGTTIKESVISFTSPSAKWINNAASGSRLKLIDTFVIANSSPQVNKCISTFNVQVVNKASTFGQFRINPGRRECNSISKNFSLSRSISLLFSFYLVFLTIPTAIPV